MNQLLRRD